MVNNPEPPFLGVLELAGGVDRGMPLGPGDFGGLYHAMERPRLRVGTLVRGTDLVWRPSNKSGYVLYHNSGSEGIKKLCIHQVADGAGQDHIN